MIEEMLIPCTGTITFFSLILGTIIVLRWIKHREVMALVTKGMLPEQYISDVSATQPRNGRSLLGWGIALAALGLALILGLWPLGFFITSGGQPYPLYFGPWMLTGLIPLFIGLALLIFHFLTRGGNGKAEASPEAMED